MSASSSGLGNPETVSAELNQPVGGFGSELGVGGS
jgi:hypothetical protein